MKKIPFILLMILFLASCGEKKENQAKKSIKVETIVATVASGGQGLSYVGVVEEREATAVSFTTMGVIRRMMVREGQMVHRGQLLAEIDASTSNSGVAMAQASAQQARDMEKQAEDTYAQAKDAYDRMKILHDNGSLPEIKWVEVETRLKQAETALNTARSGVTSARAAEQIARKGVADTRLIAPVSGVVGRRLLDVGETALPSQAVVSILDISTVKVKVSIPETELKNIGASTPSMISVAAINRSFSGGHIEKGVQADVLTHTYDVRINVANPEHKLLPGMVASVRFPEVQPGAASSVYVPVSAVQHGSDGSHFVWTIDNENKAHRSEVTLGSTMGNHIAVAGGIKAGERIVTEGYQKLSEGTPVIY